MAALRRFGGETFDKLPLAITNAAMPSDQSAIPTYGKNAPFPWGAHPDAAPVRDRFNVRTIVAI